MTQPKIVRDTNMRVEQKEQFATLVAELFRPGEQLLYLSRVMTVVSVHRFYKDLSATTVHANYLDANGVIRNCVFNEGQLGVLIAQEAYKVGMC